jgi:hypothetical protein
MDFNLYAIRRLVLFVHITFLVIFLVIFLLLEFFILGIIYKLQKNRFIVKDILYVNQFFIFSARTQKLLIRNLKAAYLCLFG